jgi:serine/threonine-protein kinase
MPAALTAAPATADAPARRADEARVTAWLADAFAPSALGARYQPVRRLGRGATGEVLLARERLLHRTVALKLLHPELARSPAARERFRREARILAQLPAHPAVVGCYAYDEVALPDGTVACGLSMPYVAGDTLAARLAARGRLPWAEAAAVVATLADALAHAHAHGVVHRDLKPENVLVAHDPADDEAGAGASPHVLLTDFGVAARPSHDDPRAADHSAGTPRYMAPEQFAGDHAADPRSDVYALGALAYHLLAGRPPFDGPNAGAVAVQHCTAPVPPLGPLAPGAPAALVDLVHRCLAKDPAERWPSARAVAEAVRAAVDGPPAPPRGARAWWRRLVAPPAPRARPAAAHA